jgi:hypothetical protein
MVPFSEQWSRTRRRSPFLCAIKLHDDSHHSRNHRPPRKCLRQNTLYLHRPNEGKLPYPKWEREATDGKGGMGKRGSKRERRLSVASCKTKNKTKKWLVDSVSPGNERIVSMSRKICVSPPPSHCSFQHSPSPCRLRHSKTQRGNCQSLTPEQQGLGQTCRTYETMEIKLIFKSNSDEISLSLDEVAKSFLDAVQRAARKELEVVLAQPTLREGRDAQSPPSRPLAFSKAKAAQALGISVRTIDYCIANH